ADVQSLLVMLFSLWIFVHDVDGIGGRLVAGVPTCVLPISDPEGRSYSSWASFSDPDGNSWMLQEIKTRLPGRGFGVDVATLTERSEERRVGTGTRDVRGLLSTLRT